MTILTYHLSSFTEAFPNCVGEAMACGVPCVVTRVGDMEALVGDTGVIVPPGAPESLARGMLSVLRMTRQSRVDLGSGARERICRHYGLDRMVAAYEKCYTELVQPAEDASRVVS